MKLYNSEFSTNSIPSVKNNGHNNWPMMELLIRITKLMRKHFETQEV